MLFLPYLWQGIELEEMWLEGLSLHGLLVLCSYWGLEEIFVDVAGRTKFACVLFLPY